MASMYEQCMAGMIQECEEVLAVVLGLCPWMGEGDVATLRRVMASHYGFCFDDSEDLGVMAGDLLALAARSEEVGDRRRQWTFEQWYGWTCAAMRGEEYQWLEMPEELCALP